MYKMNLRDTDYTVDLSRVTGLYPDYVPVRVYSYYLPTSRAWMPFKSEKDVTGQIEEMVSLKARLVRLELVGPDEHRKYAEYLVRELVVPVVQQPE